MRRIATYGVIVAVLTSLLLLGGCKKADAEANESAAKASQAGRLVRSSQQEFLLDEAQIGQVEKAVLRGDEARDLSASQRTKLADQFVTRMRTRGDFSAFDEFFAEYDSLEKAATDDAARQQLAEKALRASRALLQQEQAITEAMRGVSDQRIKRARTLLAGAKDASAHLMAGSLEFMVARRQRATLRELDIAAQMQLADAAPLVVSFSKVRAFADSLPSYLPDEAIAHLRDQLEGTGGKAGLRSQLSQARSRSAELVGEQEELAERLDNVTTAAAAVHAQYLATAREAELAEGERRYELRRQAYVLRAGDPERPQQRCVVGYDADIEILQSELAVATQRADRARLRVSMLERSVEIAETSLAGLENSGAFAAVESGRLEAQRQLNEVLTDLQRFVEADLPESDQAYSDQRVAAVQAYEQAAKAFAKASRGRQPRHTRQYADDMAAAVNAELAQLWRADAAHYKNMASGLVILDLDNAPEIKEMIERYQADYLGNAELAVEAAEKYAPDEEEGEEDATAAM